MDVKDQIQEFDVLKRDRSNWDNLYQVLGKYVSLIKQNFNSTQQSGEFLVEDVYDATGAFAAQNSASALLGMLWPGTAKQAIELMPPRNMEMTTELDEFFSDMTSRLIAAMDDPNAGLALALDEYMLDQVIFGTSGVGVEAGKKSLLQFKPYGVKEMYIEEGADGKVADIYLMFEWRLKRVIAEYGLDNLSEKLQDKAKNGKMTDMVKILVCITPRTEFKAEKGVLAMPYSSTHIEYDSKNALKESGFEELPIQVGRFRKLLYERYGRSPASNALPDIREANALREGLIVATEKILDMPKGVLNDGLFGGGTVDLSAGSLTVFNSSGMPNNHPPIFEIGSQPNLPWAEQRLQKLEDTISRHFSVDRLLDMNNQQEMTFGEAQIRNQIRNQSLSSLFSRQIGEVITPLIERCVKILWRTGEFGVIKGSVEERELIAAGERNIRYIPDALVEVLDRGDELYRIVYKTQAANASRAEEYMGIVDLMNIAMQAAGMDESVADRVDLHDALKNIAAIRGIPVGVLRQDDAVEEIAQAKAQRRELMQGMAMASEAAGAAKDIAQAQAVSKQE